MKSQSVVVSAYIATLLFVIVLTMLYVNIYPYTVGKVFEQRESTVVQLVWRKVHWSARELADTIASTLGADYVYVNVTVYNLLNDSVVYRESYVCKPVNIDPRELTYYHYHVTRLKRDGYMYIYDIEVGYR